MNARRRINRVLNLFEWQSSDNRRKAVMYPALILALLAIALSAMPTTVKAAPDPLTCQGYPEPRVFLDSQSWWTSRAKSAGTLSEHVHTESEATNFGHIHIGMCFPYKQQLRGVVEFDIRVILHDNPGTLAGIHGGAVETGVQTGELNNGPKTCPNPGTCTFWFKARVDTSKSKTDGRKEWRFHAHVKTPDEKEMLVSTGWQTYFANGGGRAVKDYRDSDTTIGRGWYTKAGYVNAALNSDIPLTPVSGVWSFKVNLTRGSGGLKVKRHKVILDADFHAGIPGTILKAGKKEWSGWIELDTRTLSNGTHRLLLKTDAREKKFARSTNSGVLVIPFVVDN